MNCAYVFAPGTALQAEYVAEVITPTYDGGAVDVVDALITNKGPHPTDVIHILYPHGFPYSENHGWLRIEDITGTFFTKDSPWNVIYNSSEGIRLEPGPLDSAGRAPFNVRMPDPADLTKDIVMSGDVAGKSDIRPYPGLNQTQWDILTDLGWCLATCHLTAPLMPDEARWFRWTGRPHPEGRNRLSRLERAIAKLIGTLAYRYIVLGPLNVRHNFRQSLQAYKRAMSGHPLANLLMPELLDLEDKAVAKGLDAVARDLVVRDWRIHVFPDVFRRLEDPAWEGDIRPVGGLANELQHPALGTIECYQWEAGEANLPAQRHNGHFSASFRCRYFSVWVGLLPVAAALLSLAGLILGLLALLK